MSRPVVLYYSPAGNKRSNKVRTLAIRLGARLVSVADDDAENNIADLIGEDDISDITFGGDVQGSVHESGKAFEDELPEKITEEMMVFYNFSEEEFDRFLRELKKSHLDIGLKAFVTRTNAKWPFIRLYAEIKKEREYIKNNSGR